MNIDLTPIKRLDIALKAFHESKLWMGMDRQRLKHHSGLVDDDEVDRILLKLFKDEFIVQTDPTSSNYKITYDGLIWYLSQGYEGDLRRKNADSDRVEKLESDQQELAVKVHDLTKIAAYGTAGFLLWEVIKYFVFEHHWYLYHS